MATHVDDFRNDEKAVAFSKYEKAGAYGDWAGADRAEH